MRSKTHTQVNIIAFSFYNLGDKSNNLNMYFKLVHPWC